MPDEPQLPRSSTHICPRVGCDRRVPDYLFACRDDWFALPRGTRNQVYRTALLPITNPERAAVVRQARRDWGDDHTATEVPSG